MAGGSFPRQAELVADLGDDSAPGDRPRALTGSCQDRVASWSWHGAWKGENLVPGSAGAQGVCGSESTWKGREGGEQVPARRCLWSGSPCHLCPNRDTSQSKSAVTTTLDSR